MTIQGIKKDLVKKAAKAMVPRLREEFLSKGGRQEDFDEALAMNRVCSFFESQPPVFWDQIAISEDASLDEIAQDIADSLEEAIYLERMSAEDILQMMKEEEGISRRLKNIR
ncbi:MULTISPECIES: hypothetical protein [Acetomicrobium]|uniref:Uncharacterized protein n=1 Tax=Acetomicrobium hydrogeniformans ATCC BAA-1850 TaxID=592015 RepID=A0A0T5X8X3_9BACT|nr:MULTISPECIES: hypothetical protein [Acetomicrobium]KRT34871.1 hypothetical protein HMPREF1705_04122 [Acetomicrobium hydrogeniformans ATCC BAA-1850]